MKKHGNALKDKQKMAIVKENIGRPTTCRRDFSFQRIK